MMMMVMMMIMINDDDAHRVAAKSCLFVGEAESLTALLNELASCPFECRNPVYPTAPSPFVDSRTCVVWSVVSNGQ